jgi:hypothetical protein
MEILQAGISVLRRRGMEQILIDWTSEIGFYSKSGFGIWKQYEAYSKQLNI